MSEFEGKRVTDLMQRLDRQDKVLDEVKSMLIRHQLAHEATDPAIAELVDILKGAKLLKRVAIGLVGTLGAVWAFMEFAWKHVVFVK